MSWFAIGVALLSIGCGVPSGVHRLENARARWGDSNGPFVPVVISDVELPGRGSSEKLELCFDVPALAVPDPALLLDEIDGLVEGRMDGRPIRWLPDSNVLPLSENARETCLDFRGWHEVAPTRTWVGSQQTMLLWRQRFDIFRFATGFLFATLGALLLAASLRRGMARAYRWIGVFSATAGIMSVAQSDSLRAIVYPSPEIWRWVRGLGLCLLPLGIAMFIREIFGDTRRGALRRVAQSFVAIAAIAAVGEAAHLVSILKTRRLMYIPLAALVWFAVGRMQEHVRAGDRAATWFQRGALAFAVVSLPDIAAGLGLIPGTFGFSNIGVLVFVVALGVVVESRYGEQRDRLLATTQRLRSQVGELEARREEIEELNEELRHQLERRSRELRDALGGHASPATAAQALRALEPGEMVDERYRIKARLGAGAMGVVYEAERDQHAKAYALKMMIGVIAPEHASRFAREAEIAAKVRHPNLVPLVDVGLARGVPYLVMELVRGKTLEEMRDRFGDATWGMPLLVDIAKGLSALHAQGVVHRDLKPSNILVDLQHVERPVARLADFGVARTARESLPDATLRAEVASALAMADTLVIEPELTAANAIVGTPKYIPPEAAHGVTMRAADIFAFGIVIHEVVTGAYPFDAPPLFVALAGGVPVPVLQVGGRLGEIVRRALDPEPERRPDALELADWLAHVAEPGVDRVGAPP